MRKLVFLLIVVFIVFATPIFGISEKGEGEGVLDYDYKLLLLTAILFMAVANMKRRIKGDRDLCILATLFDGAICFTFIAAILAVAPLATLLAVFAGMVAFAIFYIESSEFDFQTEEIKHYPLLYLAFYILAAVAVLV